MRKIFSVMMVFGAVGFVTAPVLATDTGPPSKATTIVKDNNCTGPMATATDHGLVTKGDLNQVYIADAASIPTPSGELVGGDLFAGNYACEHTANITFITLNLDLKNKYLTVGRWKMVNANEALPIVSHAEHAKALRAQWQWRYASRPVPRC